VLNLAANRVANAGARSLDRQANILNVGSLGQTYIGPAVQAIRGEGITNNPSAEGIGGEAPAAVAPPTDWSCSRPGFAGPYPCTNRQGNPMANSYCHAGGVFCVLPPRAPAAAAGPKFPSFVPFHRAPSYNLGPQKAGANRQTYNSAAAIRTGIYETSDGLLHRRDGHGLAMF